ncbi:DNA double-strand break repair nuclease NurA [Natrinema sp. H-ect4]|uniref:DNA double-strand break repair nuclease NurA n=1 Tax=Natrinema sp. H-ect4 TaxID=3242699 RepID=UPI0035A8CF8E
MPLYRRLVAQELEEKKSEFSRDIGSEAIEAYQEAAETLAGLAKEEFDRRVSRIDAPSAIPTQEFAEHDGLCIPFEASTDWQSHEDVNTWARSQFEGVTTVAADGSQIDPIAEFEQPVGLVQVVWMENNHEAEGDYEEDVETELLTPDDLLFEDPNTGYVHVDEQEVPVTRFETEMEILEDRIAEHSEDEKRPVVMYDGSLILSFTQMMDQKTQTRYGEALSRLIAASKHHNVPVLGYISGSRATELGKLLKELDIVDADRSVRDYQILDELLTNWGSRTVLFRSQRDSTLQKLQTTYQGTDYDFSEDILFTYLNTGPGPQLDRIELPRWVYEADLVDHILSVVRAEAGVGRGYPEIIQSVDTDAVLSREDRDEFLRLCQEFSDENDIEMRWNNKALSKKRRRR